jgi:hypothetical protein
MEDVSVGQVTIACGSLQLHVTQPCGKVPARHASGTKRKTIMEQKRHDLL